MAVRWTDERTRSAPIPTPFTLRRQPRLDSCPRVRSVPRPERPVSAPPFVLSRSLTMGHLGRADCRPGRLASSSGEGGANTGGRTGETIR